VRAPPIFYTITKDETMPREDYQERKEARIDRLHERAENAADASNAAFEQSSKMADAIPFGQPILVGHHSESRDRRYRDRITNKMRQSAELSTKAKALKSRAHAAESSTAVSSDDPEAVRLLKEQVEALRAKQEADKAANRKLRKAKIAVNDLTAEALGAAGVEGEQARELIQLWQINCLYGEYVKLPGYRLSNRNANIKRLESRIKELQALEATEDATFVRDGFELVHNTEVNRVQLVFPGKPSEAIRTILKSSGFRWSRREGAWQRLLNSNGMNAAEYVATQIEALKE
jgi:hypothetical protein